MVQWKLIPSGAKAGGCDYCSNTYAEFVTGENIRTAVKDEHGKEVRTKSGTVRTKSRDKRICEECLRKQFPQKDHLQWQQFLEDQRDLVARARNKGHRVRESEKAGRFDIE